jgi:hypothetical protein
MKREMGDSMEKRDKKDREKAASKRKRKRKDSEREAIGEIKGKR